MEVYLIVGVVGVVVLVAIIAARKLLKRSNVSGDVPPDTIILHHFGRGRYCPDLSPFCVKLETYLRMAKLKYKATPSGKFSSKGKIPWIELNGEQVADSQFSIEFLNKKFDVNLKRGLSPIDVATARAFQKMVDEHTYWFLVLYRWVFREKKVWLDEVNVPWFALWYIRRTISKQVWCQGLGRHTRAEVDQLLEGDLRTLSEFLGTKEYMMGRQPSEVDCSVFGQLSQLLWSMRGSLASKLITEEFPNLKAYCERIKEQFWPDWDDCLSQ